METIEIEKGQVWQNMQGEDLFVLVKSINKAKDSIKGQLCGGVNSARTLLYSIEGFKSYWKLTDKVFTRVVFKKFEDGDVIAFLLDVDDGAFIMSYMHVGQHSSASVDLPCSLKACTAEEYKDLKAELESRDYVLQVVKSPKAFMYKGK